MPGSAGWRQDHPKGGIWTSGSRPNVNCARHARRINPRGVRRSSWEILRSRVHCPCAVFKVEPVEGSEVKKEKPPAFRHARGFSQCILPTGGYYTLHTAEIGSVSRQFFLRSRRVHVKLVVEGAMARHAAIDQTCCCTKGNQSSKTMAEYRAQQDACTQSQRRGALTLVHVLILVAKQGCAWKGGFRQGRN